MKNWLKVLVFSLVLSILSGCSSKPVEEYKDYFYTSSGKGENTNFTFVLYLGTEGEEVSDNLHRDPTRVPQRQKAKKTLSKSNDDFMSLSFRMEEEAFKRLEILLATKDFCNGGIDYKSNEYTWLRYTITGICRKR